MRKFILNVIGSVGHIIKYGCIVYCTLEYVGEFVVCSGPSMEPTIHTDDVLLTEHISVLRGLIKKGDIVIAKCPTDPKQQICKRVVAVAGDKVGPGFGFSKMVPTGHVWLEGDNSGNSSDSRSYGPVPIGLVRSRAICKIWPPKDISLLTS